MAEDVTTDQHRHNKLPWHTVQVDRLNVEPLVYDPSVKVSIFKNHAPVYDKVGECFVDPLSGKTFKNFKMKKVFGSVNR